MTRITIGQKAQRVLKFLMGARNPKVAAALAAHGFTEKELREGIEHLSALTRIRLNMSSTVEDPTLIDALDAFENRWFPIARASLERHYPDVAARFFQNLSQTSGVEVAISVATFLERMRELEDPQGSFGADGQAAHALLATRGLTADVVAAAQSDLDKLGTFHASIRPTDGASEQQAALEGAMWSWYLEWSGIARATISDRRVLRSLGFLKSERATADGESTGSTSSLPTGPEPLRLPAAATMPAAEGHAKL